MTRKNILDSFPNFFQGIKDSVVVIDQDGKILEEYLDEMPYNHAVLTNYMAFLLGCFFKETYSPFLAATNLSEQGVVVLHMHRDGRCLCFLPDTVTKVQEYLLEKKFCDSDKYVCQCIGEIGIFPEEGFISSEEVIKYTRSILKEDNKCSLKKLYVKDKKI